MLCFCLLSSETPIPPCFLYIFRVVCPEKQNTGAVLKQCAIPRFAYSTLSTCSVSVFSPLSSVLRNTHPPCFLYIFRMVCSEKQNTGAVLKQCAIPRFAYSTLTTCSASVFSPLSSVLRYPSPPFFIYFHHSCFFIWHRQKYMKK